MIGIARAPGTCGELVQGKVGGVNFLITCPIDIYSTVKVELNHSGALKAVECLSKAKQAVAGVLGYLNRPELGADIYVRSDIPKGKGMASSTADIAAVCAATAAALGTFLSPDEIARIALSIEPTDGIMFQGITLFDHVKGKLCRVLGSAPDMEVVIIDLGGTVDTLQFNSNREIDCLNLRKEQEVTNALETVINAYHAANNDSSQYLCQKVGEASTMSAFANQHMLNKPGLEDLLSICKKFGGVGINVAHSGTVVGLLFSKGFPSYNEVSDTLAMSGFRVLGKNRVINGGVQVLKEGIGDTAWHQLDTFMGEISGKLKKNTG